MDASGSLGECYIYGHLTTIAPECHQKTWEILSLFKFVPGALVQIKLSKAEVVFESIIEESVEGEVSKIDVQFIEVTTKDQRTIAAAHSEYRFRIGDFCALYRSPYLTIHSSCFPSLQQNRFELVQNSVFPADDTSQTAASGSYQQTLAYLLLEPVDWRNVDMEYPVKNIGMKRRPIHSLRYLFGHLIPHIMTLADRYTYWRQFGGDGNSYYRIMAVAYLEHLCRRTTHPSELNAFYSAIFHQTKLSISAENAPYIKYFLKKLKELYTDKQSSPNTNLALIKLQALLQDHSFDEAAVVAIRSMTSFTSHQLLSHPDFAPFIDSPDKLTREVETLGEDAEGIIFAVMANALNAKIVHITLDPKYNEISITPYTKGQRIPVLHVLVSPGHYYMLYSARVQLIDQYFYNPNSFLDPLLEVPLDDHDVWEQV